MVVTDMRLWAPVEKVRSQSRNAVMLADKKLMSGKTGELNLLDFRSHRAGRRPARWRTFTRLCSRSPRSEGRLPSDNGGAVAAGHGRQGHARQADQGHRIWCSEVLCSGEPETAPAAANTAFRWTASHREPLRGRWHEAMQTTMPEARTNSGSKKPKPHTAEGTPVRQVLVL